MSDKPLFENMDEQEATYAPQQLPPGSTQADQAQREEGATGDERPVEGAVVAGAAAGLATSNAASGAAGPTGAGGLPAASPIVAGEALEGNTGVEDAADEQGSR